MALKNYAKIAEDSNSCRSILPKFYNSCNESGLIDYDNDVMADEKIPVCMFEIFLEPYHKPITKSFEME
jgi:hypothetical protein